MEVIASPLAVKVVQYKPNLESFSQTQDATTLTFDRPVRGCGYSLTRYPHLRSEAGEEENPIQGDCDIAGNPARFHRAEES